MSVTTNDPAGLLRLLQLTDSGFPTGAFAFSHGLEGLYAAGWVQNEADVASVVAAQVHEGFAGIEGPAAVRAWRAAQVPDADGLWGLDTHVSALKPVPAFHSGSIRTGRRLLESASGLLASEALAIMRDGVARGTIDGHHAVVFGVVMAAAGVDEAAAVTALGAGFVNGLVSAAVRLGIIGQVAAQRIVASLHGSIVQKALAAREMELDDMGGYLPWADIAGLRQPTLTGRIFAS